jgi:hypothetical protein
MIINIKDAIGQSETDKQSVIIEGSGGAPTSVTVSNEYEVEMSASVEKSQCLKCLDNLYITDCQSIGFCLDVLVY